MNATKDQIVELEWMQGLMVFSVVTVPASYTNFLETNFDRKAGRIVES